MDAIISDDISPGLTYLSLLNPSSSPSICPTTSVTSPLLSESKRKRSDPNTLISSSYNVPLPRSFTSLPKSFTRLSAPVNDNGDGEQFESPKRVLFPSSSPSSSKERGGGEEELCWKGSTLIWSKGCTIHRIFDLEDYCGGGRGRRSRGESNRSGKEGGRRRKRSFGSGNNSGKSRQGGFGLGLGKDRKKKKVDSDDADEASKDAAIPGSSRGEDGKQKESKREEEGADSKHHDDSRTNGDEDDDGDGSTIDPPPETRAAGGSRILQALFVNLFISLPPTKTDHHLHHLHSPIHNHRYQSGTSSSTTSSSKEGGRGVDEKITNPAEVFRFFSPFSFPYQAAMARMKNVNGGQNRRVGSGTRFNLAGSADKTDRVPGFSNFMAAPIRGKGGTRSKDLSEGKSLKRVLCVVMEKGEVLFFVVGDSEKGDGDGREFLMGMPGGFRVGKAWKLDIGVLFERERVRDDNDGDGKGKGKEGGVSGIKGGEDATMRTEVEGEEEKDEGMTDVIGEETVDLNDGGEDDDDEGGENEGEDDDIQVPSPSFLVIHDPLLSPTPIQTVPKIIHRNQRYPKIIGPGNDLSSHHTHSYRTPFEVKPHFPQSRNERKRREKEEKRKRSMRFAEDEFVIYTSADEALSPIVITGNTKRMTMTVWVYGYGSLNDVVEGEKEKDSEGGGKEGKNNRRSKDSVGSFPEQERARSKSIDKDVMGHHGHSGVLNTGDHHHHHYHHRSKTASLGGVGAGMGIGIGIPPGVGQGLGAGGRRRTSLGHVRRSSLRTTSSQTPTARHSRVHEGEQLWRDESIPTSTTTVTATITGPGATTTKLKEQPETTGTSGLGMEGEMERFWMSRKRVEMEQTYWSEIHEEKVENEGVKDLGSATACHYTAGRNVILCVSVNAFQYHFSLGVRNHCWAYLGTEIRLARAASSLHLPGLSGQADLLDLDDEENLTIHRGGVEIPGYPSTIGKEIKQIKQSIGGVAHVVNKEGKNKTINFHYGDPIFHRCLVAIAYAVDVATFEEFSEALALTGQPPTFDTFLALLSATFSSQSRQHPKVEDDVWEAFLDAECCSEPTIVDDDNGVKWNCSEDFWQSCLLSLHLLHQEFTILITLESYAAKLVPVLQDLAALCAGSDWDDFYSRCRCKGRLIQPKPTQKRKHFIPPPDLLRSCRAILNRKPYTWPDVRTSRGTAGGKIFPFQDPHRLTREILSTYLALGERTLGVRTRAIWCITGLDSLGWTREQVQNLSVGLSPPIWEAIRICQQDPPIANIPGTYRLIDRKDLLAQIEPRSSSYRDKLMPSLRKVEKPQHSLMFQADLRVKEAAKMLQYSEPLVLQGPPLNLNDPALPSHQQHRLWLASHRVLALPIGNAMFTFRSCPHTISTSVTIPPINVSGKLLPQKSPVKLEEGHHNHHRRDWPEYHNGVAAALRTAFPRVGSDMPPPSFYRYGDKDVRYAGYLLGLGLSGQMRHIQAVQAFRLLDPMHTMTTVSLLLGMAGSFMGTGDKQVMATLNVHLPALHPPGSVNLGHSPLVHASAALSLGILNLGLGKRKYADFLLKEMCRFTVKPTSNENGQEVYALSIGIGYGMLMMGHGDGGESRILETFNQLLGARVFPLGPAQAYSHRRTIDTNVTAPGATLALGLTFFDSQRKDALDLIPAPDTPERLDYVRPDLLLLQTLARCLISWSDIVPTQDWLYSRIPEFLRTVGPKDNPTFIVEARIAVCNLVAGAGFALALKFAGSHNHHAFMVLMSQLKWMELQFEARGDLGTSLRRHSVANCINVLQVSIAIVMAGSGDIHVMRQLRPMHGAISDFHSYGIHMATHISLGLLFMGGGLWTLGTAPASIACLIAAFYPDWSCGASDNRAVLQAQRHLWVLAAERRTMVIRDVVTNSPIQNMMVQWDAMGTGHKRIAPTTIHELFSVQSIQILGPRCWPLIIPGIQLSQFQTVLVQLCSGKQNVRGFRPRHQTMVEDMGQTLLGLGHKTGIIHADLGSKMALELRTGGAMMDVEEAFLTSVLIETGFDNKGLIKLYMFLRDRGRSGGISNEEKKKLKNVVEFYGRWAQLFTGFEPSLRTGVLENVLLGLDNHLAPTRSYPSSSSMIASSASHDDDPNMLLNNNSRSQEPSSSDPRWLVKNALPKETTSSWTLGAGNNTSEGGASSSKILEQLVMEFPEVEEGKLLRPLVSDQGWLAVGR